MGDTANGFQVNITDLTTGQSGSMTASAANGFGEVQFAPTGTSCTNIPTNFHPAYSTSSENTRVPWAAHSYNVAFSDEIGHFEYCNAVDESTGACTGAGVTDPSGVDGDDVGCFSPADSTRIRVGGCLGTDVDFDGPEYGNNWPGTLSNAAQDAQLHSTPTVLQPTVQRDLELRSGGVRSRPAADRVRDQPSVPAAHLEPCGPEPGHRMREPARWRHLLPVLLDDLGRRTVSVAARRSVHPGNDEQLRRELDRRVWSVAVAVLSGR